MPIPSPSTQFRLFWDAADAALIASGMMPLSYQRARDLFDLEIEAADVPALVEARSRAPVRLLKPQDFGQDFVLAEIRRIAFDKGSTADSRLTAIQEIVAKSGDRDDLGVALKAVDRLFGDAARAGTPPEAA